VDETGLVELFGVELLEILESAAKSSGGFLEAAKVPERRSSRL
jgi:hypothetical protein